MTRAWVVLAAAGLLSLPLPAQAEENKCPGAVKAAVEKAFPGSSVRKCDMETHEGKQTFEVKLKTKEGYTTKMNLDPAGLVLLTQQYVAVEGVPTVVMKTFKSKYPDYKVTKTEKWTYPDGKITYRVTYVQDGVTKAVVYTNEGAFVQEAPPAPDEDMD